MIDTIRDSHAPYPCSDMVFCSYYFYSRFYIFITIFPMHIAHAVNRPAHTVNRPTHIVSKPAHTVDDLQGRFEGIMDTSFTVSRTCVTVNFSYLQS